MTGLKWTLILTWNWKLQIDRMKFLIKYGHFGTKFMLSMNDGHFD